MRHAGWFLAVISAFIAGTFAPSAHTQDTPATRMVTVAYMKTKPGQRDDYLRMERNLWRPAHELLVREKKMQSWTLYEIKTLPSGDGSQAPGGDYDFVTFTVHDESREYARYENAALMTIHPDKTIESIMRRTSATRNIVRRDLWTLIDEVK